MKKLFLILFLLTAGVIYSQTLTDYYYDVGHEKGVTLTMDSTKSSYTSDYFDWTNIDGQTSIYITYSLVQGHFDYTAGHDTVLVILRGKDGLGNIINMDSLTIVSNTTQALASTQTVLTLSNHLPRVAIYVAPKYSGATSRSASSQSGQSALLKATIYAPGIDVVPPKPKVFY